VPTVGGGWRGGIVPARWMKTFLSFYVFHRSHSISSDFLSFFMVPDQFDSSTPNVTLPQTSTHTYVCTDWVFFRLCGLSEDHDAMPGVPRPHLAGHGQAVVLAILGRGQQTISRCGIFLIKVTV
jgi:hypothetical protein